MKITTLILLAAVVSAPAYARKKHERNPELCNLKTVYVDGNSESASIVRRELEKRTWLKLENDQAKADALLLIVETKSEKNFPIRSERTTVAGEIRQGTKLLWSGSGWFDEGVFNSGAGSAVKILLRALNGEAACN